jgi:hypothetical protein
MIQRFVGDGFKPYLLFSRVKCFPVGCHPGDIQFKLEGYALAGKSYQPQLFIYPADAYARVQEYGAAVQSLEKLRPLLASS